MDIWIEMDGHMCMYMFYTFESDFVSSIEKV